MSKKRAKKKRKTKKLNRFSNHKSLFVIGAMVALFLLGILGAYIYVIKNYEVTTVYVEGNVHYTNEEIIDMVLEGRYGNNSLLLSWKYKDKSIEDVPFVAKMDVALAGYVEYLERYMYFDKDGIVVETSLQKTPGIPLVTGLSFDHVVLYEPLPVEDEAIFTSILNITQLVNKHELRIDRIYFGIDNTLTLYFGDVKVALGSPEDLDEKIMELQYMLPQLEGMSGTLRMENYTEDKKNIAFEPDKEE